LAPAKGTRKRPLTIREIAGETGVSTATVSRVFNAPERVRESTRKKVLAVIDQHHFVSDGLAGSLASRRSHLLGLIIPTITNSIYALSTQAIQRAGQTAGYTVLVGVSEFSPEREARLVHEFIERRVEGLILTGSERQARVYDKITHNGVPFVITWRLARSAGLPCVSFDNRAAAAKVIDHLVSLGHRRIGLICMSTDLNDRARDRREGFEKRMAEHGLEVDPALIFERDYEFVEARAAMHQALHHPRPPTAVFCVLRQRRAGHRRHVRVPAGGARRPSGHLHRRLRRHADHRVRDPATDHGSGAGRRHGTASHPGTAEDRSDHSRLHGPGPVSRGQRGGSRPQGGQEARR
jgi:LacI family transcriptional regulator